VEHQGRPVDGRRDLGSVPFSEAGEFLLVRGEQGAALVCGLRGQPVQFLPVRGQLLFGLGCLSAQLGQGVLVAAEPGHRPGRQQRRPLVGGGDHGAHRAFPYRVAVHRLRVVGAVPPPVRGGDGGGLGDPAQGGGLQQQVPVLDDREGLVEMQREVGETVPGEREPAVR